MLYKVGTKLRFSRVTFIQYSTRKASKRYIASKIN